MSTLSSRAAPFLAGGSNPNGYINIHVSFLNDLYDENSNPDGAILMSVAENKLCGDIILSRLQNHAAFESEMLNYTDGTGLPTFKNVMADCMTDITFQLPDDVPRVKAEQIVISAGCTGLLFQLSVIMFERGDSVLIPTPYYPAFDHDFGNLGGVFRIPVDPTNANYDLDRTDLDRALALAVERGQPPKAILVCNPHNPLGKVFTLSEMLMLVDWCRSNRIHLICDEIYALSVFDETADCAFRSVVNLLDNNLGEYVHVLWGVSKDLGASGLRVGVLYSHNTSLLAAVGANNTAHQVSNAVQELLTDMLRDRTFIKALVVENNTRIARSYALLTQGLTELGLPYRRAGAGIFLFLNLQSLLSEQTFEAERKLHLSLARTIKWSLTPGEACHHTTPGFFRACYCWVSPAAIVECLRRLKEFVTARKTVLANAL